MESFQFGIFPKGFWRFTGDFPSLRNPSRQSCLHLVRHNFCTTIDFLCFWAKISLKPQKPLQRHGDYSGCGTSQGLAALRYEAWKKRNHFPIASWRRLAMVGVFSPLTTEKLNKKNLPLQCATKIAGASAYNWEGVLIVQAFKTCQFMTA